MVGSLRFFPRRAAPWLLAVLLAWALAGCGKPPATSSAVGQGLRGGPAQAADIIRTARSLLGVPYTYGGDSPKTGFDCSGMSWWVFRQHGIDLPRVTQEQFLIGRRRAWSEIEPADLLFFSIDPGPSLHVGIYAGEGKLIHSPKSGGRVREESLARGYWRSRFIGACRVLP